MLDTHNQGAVQAEAERLKLAAWITSIIKSSGQTNAEVARAIGVTPQAVAGWMRTGRIRKGTLDRFKVYFGEPTAETRAADAAYDVRLSPAAIDLAMMWMTLPLERQSQAHQFVRNLWELTHSRPSSPLVAKKGKRPAGSVA